LSFILLVVSIHVLMGSSVLVAFEKEKYFNSSVILGSILYIGLLPILYITNIISLVLIAFLRVLVDVFILAYRSYYVRKFNLLGGINA